MNLQLRIIHGGPPLAASLIYRPDEYSFDTKPAPAVTHTSILVNDLNLELDPSGKVVSIWGLCPHTGWQAKTLMPPVEAQPGSVLVLSNRDLCTGVSVRLNPAKRFTTYVDSASGWIQVQGESAAADSVIIIPGVILELDRQGGLSSLWLKPERLPPLDFSG